MKKIIYSFGSILMVVGALLIQTQKANADCSFTSPAHCFCRANNIYQVTASGCWKQVTQNNACADACRSMCQQQGSWYEEIKASQIAAGACGTVNVNITGAVGTRDYTSGGACAIATGGTLIPAVPPSCQSGFTLSGNNCIQDVTPTCPSGYTLTGNVCRKTVAATPGVPAKCQR